MNKTFVIAGDSTQARFWISLDCQKRSAAGETISLSDYITVSDQNKLRGIRNPHGVFIGTWYKRSDITDILNMLRVTTGKNSGIKKAIEVYRGYVNE